MEEKVEQSAKLKLTASEKILLHLYDYVKYKDQFETPYEVTQEGISDATGILRSHIPRSLKIYIDKHYVEEGIAHVKGIERRRKVYFLTADGIAHVKKLKENISNYEWIFGSENSLPQKELSFNSKLIKNGNIHVVKKAKIEDLIQYYNDMVGQGYNGLLISRLKGEFIGNLTNKGSIYYISGVEGKANISPENIEALTELIKNSVVHKKSIVILDGIEYISRVVPENLSIKFLDYLHDLVNSSESIIIITNSEQTGNENIISLLYRYSINISYMEHEGVKKLQKFLDTNYIFAPRIPNRQSVYGRDKIIDKIEKLLVSDRSAIVELYGMAGIGKTAVAVEVSHGVKNRMNVLWIRLHRWSTVKSILMEIGEMLYSMQKGALREYLIKKDAEIGIAIKMVQRELSNSPTLLVIDDFHNAMKDCTDLLINLAEDGISTIKIMIAGRERVDFSTVVAYTDLIFEMFTLDELPVDDLKKIVKDSRLSDKDIAYIAERIGGIPGIIKIITSIQDINSLGSSIYSFFYDEIFSSLSQDEKDMFYRLSVYRIPVYMEAFNSKTADSMNTLNRLIKKSMILMADGRYILNRFIKHFMLLIGGDVIKQYHRSAASYFMAHLNENTAYLEEVIWHAYETMDELYLLNTIIELVTKNRVKITSGISVHYEKTRAIDHLIYGWVDYLCSSEEASAEYERSLPWNYIRNPDLLMLAIHGVWLFIKEGKKEIVDDIDFGMGEYSSIKLIYRKIIKSFASIFHGNLRGVLGEMEKATLLLQEMAEDLDNVDYKKLMIWIYTIRVISDLFAGNTEEAEGNMETLNSLLSDFEDSMLYLEVSLFTYMAKVVTGSKQKLDKEYVLLKKSFEEKGLQSLLDDLECAHAIVSYTNVKCHSPMQEGIGLLAKGLDLMKNGNHAGSLRSLEKAVDLFASADLLWFSASAMIHIAGIYFMDGKNQEGEQIMLNAKKIFTYLGAENYFNQVRRPVKYS